MPLAVAEPLRLTVWPTWAVAGTVALQVRVQPPPPPVTMMVPVRSQRPPLSPIATYDQV